MYNMLLDRLILNDMKNSFENYFAKYDEKKEFALFD
jgi:hypothetical protein